MLRSPRTYARCVGAALCAMALTLSAAASAQTITQTYEVLGWTTTGKEIVAKVTVGASGLDEKGDPVNWYYTVMEVSDPTGKVINRYKVGGPSGPLQKAWNEAKEEVEGQRFLQNLGLVEAIKSPVSPDNKRAAITFTNDFAEPMKTMDPACPGCNQCTTTLQTWLVDGEQQKVMALPDQQSTGNAYPPDQSDRDCPLLDTEFYWHPTGQRAIVIYKNKMRSTGAELQKLRAHELATDGAAWKQWSFQPDTLNPQATLLRLIEETRKSLGEVTDPVGKADILSQLGDLTLRRGDIDAALGYYNAALDFEKKHGGALAGQAIAAWYKGDSRTEKKALRAALREHRRQKLFAENLGLYYLISGDQSNAQKYLQEAMDSEGGANWTDRVLLGLRILDTDLASGLAYMDNLFAGLSPNDDQVPADLLTQTAERLTREAIHARDFDAAARYLGFLDKNSPRTQGLALHLSALGGDPARVQQVIEASGVLLERNPGDCDLYLTRGLALSRATPPRPQEAYSHLAAATVCDPDQATANYYLADLLRGAGRLEEARDLYQTYLNQAPPRSGDRTRRIRREHVQRLLPRLQHKGIILLSSRCELRGQTLACRGVLHNTSQVASGPIELELGAWTSERQRRKVLEAKSELANLKPGVSLNFSLDLDGVSPEQAVELLVGRDEAEKELNRTVVQ